MTTHDADLNRPVPTRRDDDFFAVERVGEPESPSPPSHWDAAPWSPASAPSVEPTSAGPGRSHRHADPFDVTSTWDGATAGSSSAISVAPPVPDPPRPAAWSHLPAVSPAGPAAATRADASAGGGGYGFDRRPDDTSGPATARSVEVAPAEPPRFSLPPAPPAPATRSGSGYSDPFTGGFP
ncbi:hypothetical protein ND747_16220, partial [Frankia sp. R82]|nr:hypothetical protein [Frankia sp. R82]